MKLINKTNELYKMVKFIQSNEKKIKHENLNEHTEYYKITFLCSQLLLINS